MSEFFSLVSLLLCQPASHLDNVSLSKEGHHIISSGLWAHNTSKAVAEKAKMVCISFWGRWPNLPGSNALVWLAQVRKYLAHADSPGKKSFLWMSQNHKCVLNSLTCPALWKAESTNEGRDLQVSLALYGHQPQSAALPVPSIVLLKSSSLAHSTTYPVRYRRNGFKFMLLMLFIYL